MESQPALRDLQVLHSPRKHSRSARLKKNPLRLGRCFTLRERISRARLPSTNFVPPCEVVPHDFSSGFIRRSEGLTGVMFRLAKNGNMDSMLFRSQNDQAVV